MNRRQFVTTLGASFIASASARKAMASAAAFPANAAIQASNASLRRYQPDWTSLKQHTCPRWYEDAKLGIFIHYGLYSVPAWAPTTKLTERGEIDWHKFRPDLSDWFTNDPYAEWYMNAMHIKGSPTWKHHVETYGEKFDYLDFIPTFNQEVKKWDPDQWAELFKDIGARYIVPTTRHHDGFRLWPSKIQNPHRKPHQQGAERDIIGELAVAVRRQGIRMGIYFSGGLDWSFTETPIINQESLNDHIPQSEEYGRYVYALLEELIHRYQPDDIWNDIAYPKTGDVLQLLADYYNLVPDAAIDDRFKAANDLPDAHTNPTAHEHADYTSPEGVWPDKVIEKKWESCHAVGTSFGYNQNEGPDDMLSAGKLVEMLVEIVSRNGNLLLDIGPKADGSISELQLSRLRELGKWLRINGEGIYETRPWLRSDGKTQDGIPIRFTQKGDALYAILLAKPRSREIRVESLRLKEGAQIQMLGAKGNLSWAASGENLKVTMPDELPGDYAYALKISPKPV
jgi:alpha-L-fucosidase